MPGTTVDDPFDLERFVSAQDSGGAYVRALSELRRGQKQSHWMWFVFPQIEGLGASPTSRRYAIRSLDEAQAYLDHPVLGPRLVESATTVLASEAPTAVDVLGEVDALKLRSSMTLFLRARPGDTVFGEVLDRYFQGEPDPATDRALAQQ